MLHPVDSPLPQRCQYCYCDHLPGKHVTLDAVKKNVLLQVLEATGGNKTKTAEILQITVRTVHRMVHRFE